MTAYKRRAKTKTVSGQTPQCPQPLNLNGVVRFFLPPPQIFLARFLTYTLASIVYTRLRSMGVDAEIREGVDEERRAEYVEIKLPGNAIGIVRQELILPLDEAISSAKSVNMLVKAQRWARDMLRRCELNSLLWDNVSLRYDEARQRYVIDAGGFPSKTQCRQISIYPSDDDVIKAVKSIHDNLLATYMKMTYGRGFSLEPIQSETSGWTPQPKSGFVDIGLCGLGVYLTLLYTILRRYSVLISREGRGAAGWYLSVLLADLGDHSLGLAEAVEMLHVKFNETIARLLKGVSNVARIELLQLVSRILEFEILRRLAEGSIELLQRWPTIAVVYYGLSSRGAVDRNKISYVLIGGEDLVLTYYSLGSAALDLGLDTPRRLASLLVRLFECLTSSSGLFEENEVSSLLARLAIVYESASQGRIDRDVFYSLVRPLLSKIQSSGSKLPACASVARLLA